MGRRWSDGIISDKLCSSTRAMHAFLWASKLSKHLTTIDGMISMIKNELHVGIFGGIKQTSGLKYIGWEMML